MSSTPASNPGPASSSQVSLSYWQLALRDFRRNRLAMVASTVIFLVMTTAVFCPLIANNRPLYLEGVLEDDYTTSFYNVLDAARGLRATDPAAAEAAKTSFAMNTRGMRDHLAPESLARFEQLVGPMAGADAKAAEEAEKAFEAELSPDAEPRKVQLHPVRRYPAIRALRSEEIYFMALYGLFFVGIALRRVLNSPRRFVVFVTVGALAVLGVWRALFPLVEDPTVYRVLIESKGFQEHGGRAIRCPIPYGENENITEDSRHAPSYLPGALRDSLPGGRDTRVKYFHLFGTDTNGRDVLCRMVYGARVSMTIGILAVAMYVTIGIVIGACAGYFGGWIDLSVSRLIEVVICFPFLFFILSVQVFLPPSILNIVVVLGLLGWTSVARLQRAEFLRLVNLDFVSAVKALGGSDARIIFLHILPNALGPILVMVSFGIAGSILVESALSFLGFGVPQPTASWGDILNNARNDIQGTWWLTVFPGIAIFLTVTCFNLMGEGVRDALDPRRT